MDNENVQTYLKEKYPDSFKGWDEFECSFQVRVRRGERTIMLVTLHNKGKKGYQTNIHACFLITIGDDGEEVIRVGKYELADEYNSAYIPEFAK